jgi:transposase
MSKRTNTVSISTIGIDTGKNTLHMIAPHDQNHRNSVEDWAHLDERIETVTDEIEDLADTDGNCGRLTTVPGTGPIIASAMVAAIGDGAAFTKGRDFAAWLGLVPRRMSTGDRTIVTS